MSEGDDLGKYLQSMFFDENNAYIISNGSNMITVVDRHTFELVGRVESDLQVPYYGTIINGKAYVTNLASFDSNTDDFVAVINLETLEVEETIEINNTASYITQAKELLYVQNSSFGSGNSISVLNPATNTVVNTIEVAAGLNSIKVVGDRLYTLSSGTLQVINLNSGEVESQIISAEGLAGASKIDVEGQSIYYTIGKGVYSISTDATELSSRASFSI
ncbi:hypothetical protein LZ575_04845 [Antarcticibacterium sp. 1MA-6-2]|nr:hypothetical protein [Antarcticibacterium sp. 1MA-6-2]UJH91966.1 hypothetical protein LZ575_04845 [Antarcticibacterium sp. 1MA-6-2]